jgi:hypothetical protein
VFLGVFWVLFGSVLVGLWGGVKGFYGVLGVQKSVFGCFFRAFWCFGCSLGRCLGIFGIFWCPKISFLGCFKNVFGSVLVGLWGGVKGFYGVLGVQKSVFGWFFTREYTKCTAGSTFCFVVVVVVVVVLVVVVGKPLIKLAGISADS